MPTKIFEATLVDLDTKFHCIAVLGLEKVNYVMWMTPKHNLIFRPDYYYLVLFACC